MILAACLGALIFTGIFSTSGAILVDAGQQTTVTVSANGWDPDTSCSPDGCSPGLTRDGDVSDASRWSCTDALAVGSSNCLIEFEFEDPQDIEEIRLSVFQGDLVSRRFKMRINGRIIDTIETSGDTLGYDSFELDPEDSDGTSTLSLEALGLGSSNFVGLKEVLFMVDAPASSSTEVPRPSPPEAPVEYPIYLGCIADTGYDRVMTNKKAFHSQNSRAVCEDYCASLGKPLYGLQYSIECWCGECDLFNADSRFDRHGDGTCDMQCSGDATSTCGGTWAMEVFQAEQCSTGFPTQTPTMVPEALPTPSPNLGASCGPPLEFILEWFGESDLDLHVIEPSGFEVFYRPLVGDVGFLNTDNVEGYGPEIYTVRGGLSVDEDPVLGQYQAFVRLFYGDPSIQWRLTALISGRVQWVQEGDFSSGEDSETFEIILEEYIDVECTR